MPISAKFLKKFRTLRTDAQPQPPPYRPSGEADHIGDSDTRDYQLGDQDKQDRQKHNPESKKKDKDNKRHTPPNSPLQTHASGSVINIVNSTNVHFGANITNVLSTPPTDDEEPDLSENLVTETPAIISLLESQIEPVHAHLSCVAQHLGRRWKSFFRSIGYTHGQIETFKENDAQNGVQEVRYQLLLDWKRTDKDGTLGALARALWRHGDKAVVQELAAIMHHTNKR